MVYGKMVHIDIVNSTIIFGTCNAEECMWLKADCKDAIKSIDTISFYGKWLSEEIIEETVKNIPRDKIHLYTKY